MGGAVGRCCRASNGLDAPLIIEKMNAVGRPFTGALLG
jgi:hypothetical protein